ncbi:MAG: biotin carboxylase N-terminal domain-containing protein [Bacteroidales bacterium]
MKLIEKLLIANRGEIAVRIIRTAKKLGIHTVAIYAANEEKAWHVRMADEAYGLGQGELKETYLNIQKILNIAALSSCDAIHPGYGFLAENPEFAQSCEKAGFKFIGPHPEAILKMGNKILARELAEKAGIPVTKGITGTPSYILQQSSKIPFPVLVKAAAGGGGKGMRIVDNQDILAEALENTSREALAYFGDGSVYVEQYIQDPRHIEVQVLGDNHGNLVHLFERECSIQRRYQKIIEESPSPTLNNETREQMGKAAVEIAKIIGYNNAGTVEFLVDQEMKYYFLEMNTRIQVEHPVTEMVTGFDLVEEQLLIASGYPLRFGQENIKQTGHAIECRIYAEDPEHNFLPSPGEIYLYKEPRGKYIRIDSSIDKEGPILSQYDPMISKLIVWGENRDLARLKMIKALEQYQIHGIKNNLPYLKGLLQMEQFQQNQISTAYCSLHTQDILQQITLKKNNIPPTTPAIACLLFSLQWNHDSGFRSVWEKIGYWRLISELRLMIDDQEIQVEILRSYGLHFHFLLNGIEYETSLLKISDSRIEYSIDGNHYIANITAEKQGIFEINCSGFTFYCKRKDYLEDSNIYLTSHSSQELRVISLMPGKIVKVNVEAGQEVRKGDVLLIVEAMKMENNIIAPKDGVIGPFNLKPGDLVDAQSELLQILEESDTPK